MCLSLGLGGSRRSFQPPEVGAGKRVVCTHWAPSLGKFSNTTSNETNGSSRKAEYIQWHRYGTEHLDGSWKYTAVRFARCYTRIEQRLNITKQAFKCSQEWGTIKNHKYNGLFPLEKIAIKREINCQPEIKGLLLRLPLQTISVIPERTAMWEL